MARGGPRTGTAGKAYSNRSDLQTAARPPSMPTVAPAGDQPFGAQAAQVRSLQQLPLPNAAATPNPSPASAATGVAPGILPPINRPTERPNEPLTSGIDSGPGPGAPQRPPAQDMERMRSWMPALELMAEQPDASTETRNLVRYWRSFLT